jgi:hypothetical protein
MRPLAGSWARAAHVFVTYGVAVHGPVSGSKSALVRLAYRWPCHFLPSKMTVCRPLAKLLPAGVQPLGHRVPLCTLYRGSLRNCTVWYNHDFMSDFARLRPIALGGSADGESPERCAAVRPSHGRSSRYITQPCIFPIHNR